MAIHPEKITWTKEAGEALAQARATPADLAVYRADTESGTAQLWRIGGAKVSYVLTRVEQDQSGARELVIVAGAGQKAAHTIRWFTELAAGAGIETIRAHINRPGLQRMFEASGFKLEEWIMRANTHGR